MLPPLFTAGSHRTASVSTATLIISLKIFPDISGNTLTLLTDVTPLQPTYTSVFGAELRNVFTGTASVPLTGRQLSVVQLFCYFFPSQPLPHFYVSCGCQKDSVFLPYFHTFDIILIIISGFSFVKTAFRCSPGSCSFSFLFHY